MTASTAVTPPSGGAPGRAARVLVVGGGFAGFHALRRLERLLSPQTAELVLVSPTDYLLYSPLLPEVATGVIDPRHIAVPLRQQLHRTRTVLGHVTRVDLERHTVTVLAPLPGASSEGSADDGAGSTTELGWDRLVLVPGSVTRQFDIPGVAEHAHGLKTLPEAVYLRDHVLAQIDLADSCPTTPQGEAERRERLTVVAVGAGYTGTEFVAQMQRWLVTVAGRWTRTGPEDVRWVLVDVAPAVLPELGPELGRFALQLLQTRGVEVRLGVTIQSASARSVTLTDGTSIPTRTLVWGAGVAASPLVATLGLPLLKGRLVVDTQLCLPGTEHVWAAGDAAAVPDLTKRRPTDGGGHGAGTADLPPAPPTAQHAQRQGRTLARNVAASLGSGRPRAYRHRDLGLVADLGGPDAVARPLGLPLTGRLAKVVTRGYHLYALPSTPAKVRVAVDWLLAGVLPTQVTQLSAIPSADALLSQAQATGIYGPPRPVGQSAPASTGPAPVPTARPVNAAAASSAVFAGDSADVTA